MDSEDTLIKFGPTFQTKCIVSLLTDRSFVEQSADIVDPLFFENDGNRWIIDRIFWCFQKYRTIPSLEIFKKEVDKISTLELKASVIMQLKDIYKTENQNADDLKYVKDEFLQFCKNQAIKRAINKSVDLLQSGNYDQIKTVIDKAMHAGQERNIGHIYLEEFAERVNKISRNVVPTPWECFNEIMDGGLGAGELGCAITPSGGGKSWFLSRIGQHAMTLGKKVGHYTFELSQSYLGLRYDTIFTGIEPSQIRNNQQTVIDAMAAIQGQLFIKYFPTRSININAITAHLQRLQMLGHMPDILLIDYADLMRSAGKADSKHEELGYIHEEIRGMLGEYKIPGWTASQSQRSALQDDVVEADKIAGSYAKIMTDDFVFSCSRKVADKLTNTGRAHVIKNRFGPDGNTYPAELDFTHGIVEIYDENSPKGVMLKNKMATGEGMMKSVMSRKLIDLATPK